jgi:ABC-type Fe3+/spermidine/putrescine transport system ATPase subunit
MAAMTDPALASTKSMPGVAGAEGVVVERLTVRYGQTVAVDEVSLAVRRGELFFLLGPSGCGKTSLLRAIGGLEPAASGTVAIGGRDVTGLAAYRRGAPMVFQGYALWPHLSLAENVGYGLEARGVPSPERREKALAALRMVGLEERAEARPAQLSGGQQQRVALARALACEPEVVLLDEPLSNLDAKLRREMRGELVRLHSEARFTAIYVTHDQEEALSMAQRVAVMHAGRIVELGEPRELYERPRERFTAEFLGEVNWLPAERLGAGPGGAVRVRTPLGEAVVKEPATSPSTMLGALSLSNGWQLGFRPEAARLGPGPAGALQWSGRVESASFLGSEERVELVTAAGNRLVLRLGASGVRPGQDLSGHVEPGRLWLFPA